jgi:hydroxypyruvate reductase
VARARGLDARPVSGSLRGEAREAGARLAALARASAPARDTLLAAGGETTVTVRGAGRGGRCQELALAAALALEGAPGVALLAAGTDGSDGPTDAAGAFADGGSAARGRAAGRDPAADLAANDAYGFFAAEGGLLRTGPTRTNALDLVLVRIGARPAG